MAESVYTRQLFGCSTDKLLELGNQVFLADTHLVTQGSYRQHALMACDLTDGILHCIEALWQLTQAIQEQLLKQGESRLVSRRTVHPFTDFSGHLSPNRIQRHDVVV